MVWLVSDPGTPVDSQHDTLGENIAWSSWLSTIMPAVAPPWRPAGCWLSSNSQWRHGGGIGEAWRAGRIRAKANGFRFGRPPLSASRHGKARLALRWGDLFLQDGVDTFLTLL